MISLYGFPLSNYYNKIKLVLLEKDISFREELTYPSQDEAFLKRSPLGKVPFIESEHGCLSESQAILEYLEETHPENPLYPAHPFERAKCRELIQHLELNVELIARRLYMEAFFGGTVSTEIKNEVREKVKAGLKGLSRLAKFSPYILGDVFTAADCAAWVHLGAISRATRIIYSEDLAVRYLPPLPALIELMETRPHVKRVASDRSAAIKASLQRNTPP